MPGATIAYQYNQRTSAQAACSRCVTIENDDCLSVAQSIQEKQGSVCVLNMANQFEVGGDYLSLSRPAQEESLIMRTDLLQSLIKLDGVKEGTLCNPYKYALSNTIGFSSVYQRSGFGEFTCLYSSDITVTCLNSSERELSNPFIINVISSSAYNLFDIDQAPNCHLYQSGMALKIINQLRTAKAHGQRHLVLGAFGCGAFANSPYLVASIYHSVMNEFEFVGCFDSICFAIQSAADNANYTIFCDEFSKPCCVSLCDFLYQDMQDNADNPAVKQLLQPFFIIDTQIELAYRASHLIEKEIRAVPKSAEQKINFLSNLLNKMNLTPDSASEIIENAVSTSEIQMIFPSSRFFKTKSLFIAKLEQLLLRSNITESVASEFSYLDSR